MVQTGDTCHMFYSNWIKICHAERYFVRTLPVTAPEIIYYKDRYYIAALNEGALDGISIANA